MTRRPWRRTFAFTTTSLPLLLGLTAALPEQVAANDAPPLSFGRVPDEYESSGGHSLAFGNAGSAAVAGQGSVRSNPAMLALEKQYTVSAGYHWPSYGREYYQAGAVDSQTSPIAAGFTYTAGRDKFNGEIDPDDAEDEAVKLDSPIRYRAALGAAQAFNYMAIGVGAQYVEGFVNREAGFSKQKGVTLGLGVAGLLSPTLRFAAAAENITNSRVAALAPRVYRLGLAYTMFGGDVTAHVDYARRQRVPQEVGLRPGDEEDPTRLGSSEREFLAKPENMVVASFSARIQDMIRLLGSYGHEASGGQRRMLSGGLALVNPNFSLSYLVSQPYLANTKIHHAINLTMHVAL